MASWIIHLRVAEKIQRVFPQLSAKDFYIGSMAPDSGNIGSDGVLVPPYHLSHWLDPQTKESHHTAFYETYAAPCQETGGRSFYLGYYAHLLTDQLWARDIYRPRKTQYAAELAADPSFMNKIKRDWYVSDRLFLNEYPDYGPYALIRATKTYQAPALSYYTSEMICAKIAAAVAYYESMETEKAACISSVFNVCSAGIC